MAGNAKGSIKGRIGLKKAQEVIAHINELPERALTVREFIATYFDELQSTGHTLEALYHFLVSRGIEMGSFNSFRMTFSRERRAREKKAKPQPPPPEKPGTFFEPEKTTHTAVLASTIFTDLPKLEPAKAESERCRIKRELASMPPHKRPKEITWPARTIKIPNPRTGEMEIRVLDKEETPLYEEVILELIKEEEAAREKILAERAKNFKQ